MKKNLNRRKYFYLNKKKILYFLLISFLSLILFIFIYQRQIIFDNFKDQINTISSNYGYQFKNIEINGLNQVSKQSVKKITLKHLDSSIFLLPLKKISNSLREINWIKNVSLSTNYKDTLFVEVEEYKPIGIYEYNNRYFYFDEKGKIIDEIIKTYEKKLIIFSGKSSNLNAYYIIKIIKEIDIKFLNKIKKIDFIEKRRWNIILENNKKLMLSEKSPTKSIQNFLILQKKISETDFNNVMIFDLRDLKKTVLTYN